jgi:hypothetical protein
MLNRIVNYLIFGILIIGLFGTTGLVLEELKTGTGCPKILKMPMCMVIFICFLIPLIVHLFKKRNNLYFVFTSIAGSIALMASVMQFSGNAECPKTTTGTPMCYYSLLLFTSLIILKIISIKQKF